MHISHIKTMVRVGEVVTNGELKKLSFIPDTAITEVTLRDRRGRVYALVVDGIIQKLGGSQDAGGILGTLNWYLGGFAKGMSERTYCTWNFMKQHCDAGRKVEVYAVWAPMLKVLVPTMTGFVEKEVPVDFHTIEKDFNEEYYNVMGSHPFLNMQEKHGKWRNTGLMEGYINKDGTLYKYNK